ncbi:hypothetical protein A8990_14439 [Paenibacillus taihuensis]|uniref:Uncharacterized protein n=1 Tax=Paenibacillus taihuensis TaxID=1156355 RepID=A0A3D9R376_9BACL|nr:hypothetical protein A8990_14439 [Paenibacillus taihuensis]
MRSQLFLSVVGGTESGFSRSQFAFCEVEIAERGFSLSRRARSAGLVGLEMLRAVFSALSLLFARLRSPREVFFLSQQATSAGFGGLAGLAGVVEVAEKNLARQTPRTLESRIFRLSAPKNADPSHDESAFLIKIASDCGPSALFALSALYAPCRRGRGHRVRAAGGSTAPKQRPPALCCY